MIYNRKTIQNYPLLVLKMGPIKFVYNSKFEFTAKSLVTNTVVIARVLCRMKNEKSLSLLNYLLAKVVFCSN